MYIRYIYKLCSMHLQWGNYTEAAFTLMLHAKKLQVSAKTVVDLWRCNIGNYKKISGLLVMSLVFSGMTFLLRKCLENMLRLQHKDY